MIKERMFPIDKIEKGKNVILYGAGSNGKNLWKQNNQLDWCNIKLVVDKSYNKIIDFPVEVFSPEALFDINEYDYVLISILDDDIRMEIRQYLIQNGVLECKIIDDLNCFFFRDNEKPIIEYNESSQNEGKVLQVGFAPGGVMGDNVIALKLYQEIVRLMPDCEIDVLIYFKGFPEVIYGNQKNLREIIYRVPNECDREKYDLIIQSHFEPSIVYCNMSRLESISMDFAHRIKRLYQYQMKDWFMCSPAQYMNRLQWDRAQFKEWNCYTLLNASGAFDIRDSRVEFCVNERYKSDYDKLGLEDIYITFNFGASDPLKNGKRQTKMWPYEYHCKLNNLLKKHYPNIQLVQLGAADVMCVPGADRYILGRHLEVTKHVLKNALCHIDCEGGLVHIATQLGTKCIVVFGPTPVSFFGYDKNINIVSPVCKECCGLITEWYTRCYKYERNECMYSILPETVFEKIREYIQENID